MQQNKTLPMPVLSGILTVSAAATAFLLWLVYVHQTSVSFSQEFTFLPILNATFNGLSAIALCFGFSYIKQRNIVAHRRSMLTALAFSTLFLVSYIINHALHGDQRFPGHGTVRSIYLTLLASHVFLSIVVLPMILVTVFLSLTGRFQLHKKIARYTFPIWLYVSVTGVIVVVFLRLSAAS